MKLVDSFSVVVDVNDPKEMKKIIASAIGTKFISKWTDLATEMAIKAVATVAMEDEGSGQREIDIKRYAKVEKVQLFSCIVLSLWL